MDPRALFTSLRPHQWTKNLLLFAPLALSKHLFDETPLLRSLGAFALFCGLSGVVYLVNDVADIERDRLHPRKRLRPIASGAIAPRTALAFAVFLAALSLGLSTRLGTPFAVCAVTYLILNLLYSFWLKNIVIVDAISVSLGFVVRAVAGAAAIGVVFSDWLLICTILLALFLTFCKRRHELTSLSDTAVGHRKILSEYSPYLLDQMIAVVTASCLTAYAFYTTAPETVDKFKTNRLSWTLPFVLYGIFRYLYLVHQKEQGGSPSDILLADRPLLAAVGLWALAIVVIVYTAGGAPMPLLH
jgi:4-hydroxybenzoate polyprenyltransferase